MPFLSSGMGSLRTGPLWPQESHRDDFREAFWEAPWHPKEVIVMAALTFYRLLQALRSTWAMSVVSSSGSTLVVTTNLTKRQVRTCSTETSQMALVGSMLAQEAFPDRATSRCKTCEGRTYVFLCDAPWHKQLRAWCLLSAPNGGNGRHIECCPSVELFNAEANNHRIVTSISLTSITQSPS